MRLTTGLIAVVFSLAYVHAARAQQTYASTTVTATATVTPRTTLVVSSYVLQFRIEPGATQAEVTVDFSSAMRAQPGAEVALTVQAASAIRGPGGAADLDAVVTFGGKGEGIQSGVLSSTGASVAARWSGGGKRHGQLVFTLRASAPGVYTVPVSYLLGTP